MPLAFLKSNQLIAAIATSRANRNQRQATEDAPQSDLGIDNSRAQDGMPGSGDAPSIDTSARVELPANKARVEPDRLEIAIANSSDNCSLF